MPSAYRLLPERAPPSTRVTAGSEMAGDKASSSARGIVPVVRRGGLLARGHRPAAPSRPPSKGASGRSRGLAAYSCGGSAGVAPDFPVASLADAITGGLPPPPAAACASWPRKTGQQHRRSVDPPYGGP